MLQHGRANDLSQFAGGVAAKEIHLEEAVLRGGEALREDEVVERCCVYVWNSACVALHGDVCRETWNGESAVDLRKRGGERVLYPVAYSNEGREKKDQKNADGDRRALGEAA
jgi:hypothetical protein